MSKEIWKAIPNYPDYEVSSKGRVRNKKGRLLSPYFASGRYLAISLSRDKLSKKRYIHSLVLEAFSGPCPNGMECAHNNGQKQDNRISNLRYDTHVGNCADRMKHGSAPKGESHPNSKLKAGDVIAIRKSIDSSSSLSRKYGVARSRISRIRSRLEWSWLEG